MKFKKKSAYCALIQIVLFLFTCVMLNCNDGYTYDVFLRVCRIGLVSIVLESILLVWQQKRIITIINMFFLLFCLFQFGIPICFALDKNYYTYHLMNFDNEILIKASVYTILSMSLLATSFSAMLAHKKRLSKKNLLFKSSTLNDKKIVTSVSKSIFTLTSIIVLPLYLYVTYLSLSNGFSQQTRAILSSSNLFNIARSLFYSSGILYLCYNNNKRQSKSNKLIEGIIIFSIVLTFFIGARGEGLTWLVAYFYGKKTIIKETKLKKEWLFILVLILLALVSVVIAEIRYSSGTNIADVIKGNVLNKFISELGFNFTSICYVMLYTPKTLRFQYGYTYILSLLSLVPSTIDFLGFSKYFRSQLPLYKLAELLHQDFFGSLDFGVGFSFNAEAFYNFSWFGILTVVPLSAFFVWIEREDDIEKNDWNKYVKIIVLRNLFMFPRQMSFEFVNSLLYQIVFIAIIIILTRKIVYKKGRIS